MQNTCNFEYPEGNNGKKISPAVVGITPLAAGKKKVIWIQGTEPGLEEHLRRKVERVLSEWDSCNTCLQSDGITMSCLQPLNQKDGKLPKLPNPEIEPDFVCPNHDDFETKAKAFLAENPNFLQQFEKPEDGYFPLLEALRKQAALATFRDTMQWAFQHGKGGLMVM